MLNEGNELSRKTIISDKVDFGYEVPMYSHLPNSSTQRNNSIGWKNSTCIHRKSSLVRIL